MNKRKRDEKEPKSGAAAPSTKDAVSNAVARAGK